MRPLPRLEHHRILQCHDVLAPAALRDGHAALGPKPQHRDPGNISPIFRTDCQIVPGDRPEPKLQRSLRGDRIGGRFGKNKIRWPYRDARDPRRVIKLKKQALAL